MIATPLKRYSKISYGLGQPPPGRESGIPIIRATNVSNGRITPEGLIYAALADLPLHRTPLLEEGEVLVVRSGAYTGDSALVTIDWAGSAPGYDLRVTPGPRIESRFLAWSLLGKQAKDQIRMASLRAAQPHLNAEELGTVLLWAPPLGVQRKIADFLDAETAQIDALIAKKRRMIELLEEKRTATITHAVTKSFEPTVPMKDSDIPWIGEIPAHWEVARLKSLALEPLKYGANEPADEANSEHPRYVRTTDVRSDGSLREETYRSLPPETAQPYMLADGDLLFTRSGATVGKSFMYNETWGPACFAGYLIRVRLDREVAVPHFLAYFAQSDTYWRQIDATAIQATIMNVSAERYGEIRVPLPPVGEQRVIAHALHKLDETVQRLSHSITSQLELLSEYREALITAAVTGELDGAHTVAEEAS